MSRLCLASILLLASMNVLNAEERSEKISFMREVLPILKDNCFACHDAKNHKGKYDMTSFDTFIKGGSRGEAVIAGKPEESFLWTLTSGQEEPKMPPKEAGTKLTPRQVALLERWIKEGATFDGTSPRANLLAELRQRWQPPTPPAKYGRPVTVRSLAFTPAGTYLLSSGYYEILIWEAATGKLAARLRTRAERANAMLFLDGTTLVVAGGRPGLEGDVRTYHFDADRIRQSTTVVMLDGVKPGSPTLAQELLQIDDEILALALSPDGTQLAAAGCDRKIRVWNVKEGFRLMQTIENHADWVVSLAFSPDGQKLFTASRDKTAKVWDFAKKETVWTFPGHQAMVEDVQPDQGGRAGISIGDDGQLRFWRTEGNQQQSQVRVLPAHPKGGFKLARHPTQARLATGGADGTVRLWNLPNANPLRILTGHTDAVYALTFSPDGNFLASGAWNGEIRLWDATKGTLVRTILAGPGLSQTAERK